MATAQKSGATLMHEQWIAEVVAHTPKHVTQGIKHDARNFIAAVAVILIIAVAALSIMRPCATLKPALAPSFYRHCCNNQWSYSC